MIHDNGIDLKKARTFLTEYYELDDADTLNLEIAGEGAWSRCFGFDHNGQPLVIKFSQHLDDLEKDQRAYTYVAPDLPIPQVLDIGRAFDGHYAIATKVTGVPLESVEPDHWTVIVPSIVDALEAMRIADLSSTMGYGGWGADGNGWAASWSEDLLSIAKEPSSIEEGETRGDGARAKLATFAPGQEAFEWGIDLLKQAISDDIPRSLIHGDLMNRNVFVGKSAITGLFDWGCSRYGDHLYDLAWFEFWATWYPKLDVSLLRSTLGQRWQEVGYEPHNLEQRLKVCYLHIGLDHLAYNAYIDDWDTLLMTADRMRTLCST